MRRKKISMDEVSEDHSNYLPPWRERLLNNELGPEYGPEMSGYIRMQEEYAESLEGGGLWDPLELPARKKQEEKKAKVRYDAEKAHRFVRLHSHEIPMRELEVYFAVYMDLLSDGQAARKIGISRNNFDVTLKNFRRRIRGER